MLQVFLDVFAFGLDPRAAVELPRVHHQWSPDELVVEAEVAPEVRAALAARGHKVVVLNFWGSWCSVCKSEKPSLTAFTRDLAQDGFEVVTVASDASWDAVRRVLPDGAPYRVLLDQTAEDGEVGSIAHSWGVKAVPETFIIDKQGKVRMYLVNKRDWRGDIACTCVQSLIDE